MVLDAAGAWYAAHEVEAPQGIAASWQGDIPVARGLGASACARAAGLAGANVLAGRPLDLETVLTLGSRLEGHADNMAPALFGGLQVAVQEGETTLHAPVRMPPGLRVVLLVPDKPMLTDESRRVLPAQVPREDAVHNVGRACLLVAALTAGRLDLLGPAMDDRLHQPARSRLLPGMYDVIGAARKAGALCAYLSGGGSTIAAWTVEDAGAVADAMLAAAKACGVSGKTMTTTPSQSGVQITQAE
jgi:homoserine kinase